MEGRSLVPAFSGRAIQREALFWEHEGNRALRIGDWKLVAKGAGGPWELYNMKSDRTEMHDLANAESERVRQMVATWDRWAERTHAVPWPWKPAYGAAVATPSADPIK
jgi:arylsulfatase